MVLGKFPLPNNLSMHTNFHCPTNLSGFEWGKGLLCWQWVWVGLYGHFSSPEP